MFLSRLELNIRNINVQRDLNNCQNMHRTIMRGFPDIKNKEAREKFRVLYRVDIDSMNRIKVLVQSKNKPNWDFLKSNYLSFSNNKKNPAMKTLDTLFNSIQPGTILKFRLRANPTRKLDGKRVELYKMEDLQKWILRKAKDCGFIFPHLVEFPKVPAIIIQPEGKLHGYRKSLKVNQKTSEKDKNLNGNQKYKELTFFSVIYKGILKVQEKEKFLNSIQKGIGPAKAYGYGLLSVRIK